MPAYCFQHYRTLERIPMSIRIDRCICYNKAFSELSEIARQQGANTLQELQVHATFGLNCRLCHPYVKRMLQTGETSFSEILTEPRTPTPVKPQG